MSFDWMKRREFVALLGLAAAWPLAARAEQQAHSSRARFDPRVTPARGDLAAKHLDGAVEAQRFVEGKDYEIGAAQAPLRQSPSHEAMLLTEALKGERITIYDIDGQGWAWGQLAGDSYVGYVPQAALVSPGPPPTHKVTALRTFVLPGPSVRLPPREMLSFGSQLAVTRVDDLFATTASGGYVPVGHLAPVATMETDFVVVAERFVGTPYLWGGKSALGLDCSGLLQLALAACGVRCPRDTDMQERAVGSALANPPKLDQLRRGDLLFWKGHVAIARDGATLVHANATHMAVTVEPIASAIPRIRTIAGEITSVRRLPQPS
jgi:cell wall-associated NlpC family hydrolase